MLYRESGQFKTSYAKDQAIFPIAQDRIVVVSLVIIGVALPYLFADQYWLTQILIPFTVFSMAAIGLNILTGYCGQISLGTAAFMAVGAYASFKLTTAFPEVNVVIWFLVAGLITAAVGILFGLPSLRIKGFYLAVATLAAQFFLTWMFNKIGWFANDDPTGSITMPPRTLFGEMITGPAAKPHTQYLVCAVLLIVFALAAKNLVRSRTGRAWMAIRDMDIAAEIIGIRPLRTKLLAFAISSFYSGVAGAMFVGLYLGNAETLAFSIGLSFDILFMVIIGGLGSILGSFLGAGFIVLVPIFLKNLPSILGVEIPSESVDHLRFMVLGALIVFFLIVEPHGLARLWQLGKEKLRLWPFPH
ncbi:MAG: branched-chain amino acid ABC transporter permease [Alphaproteobacteria bacterium]